MFFVIGSLSRAPTFFSFLDKHVQIHVKKKKRKSVINH